jgi:hypothetical protein
LRFQKKPELVRGGLVTEAEHLCFDLSNSPMTAPELEDEAW